MSIKIRPNSPKYYKEYIINTLDREFIRMADRHLQIEVAQAYPQ